MAAKKKEKEKSSSFEQQGSRSQYRDAGGNEDFSNPAGSQDKKSVPSKIGVSSKKNRILSSIRKANTDRSNTGKNTIDNLELKKFITDRIIEARDICADIESAEIDNVRKYDDSVVEFVCLSFESLLTYIIRIDVDEDNISDNIFELEKYYRKIISSDYYKSRFQTKDKKIRKKYRRATELPDPSKEAAAEVNRTKQQIKVRLPQELIDEINDHSQQSGISRNAWLERAIRNALQPK